MPTAKSPPPDVSEWIETLGTVTARVNLEALAEAERSMQRQKAETTARRQSRSGNPKRPRRSKYRNNPVYQTPDGHWVGRGYEGEKRLVFDSEKEWKRWLFLVEEQKAGRIQGLRHHKTYKLYGKNGGLICRYEADFTYVCNGRLVVEDVKSEMTRKLPTWKIKKALMLDNYGIDVVEV